MEKNILLLDGNSLVNRAFYAIQRPMITREGVYTQGIFGFLNMLSKLEKDYEPGYIAVCFDLKAPTFRHTEYEAYKAGRKKMPPELAMEIPILKDVLRAMNIPIVEQEGWEADDFLGTLSLRAEEAGLLPLIVTGDRDSFQLASERTKIVYTKRGVSEFDLIDASAMEERYGLTPTQFIDLKGLMGDSSDNIPGVPGVGEKTALPLIQQYGSIEELISHAEEIPREGLRKKIIENAQTALLSKRLATIVRTIPGEWDFEAMRVSSPKRDALIALYKKLEFNVFLRRLQKESESFSDNPFTESAEDAKEATEDAPSAPPLHAERTIVFSKSEGVKPCTDAITRAKEEGRTVILTARTDGNHLDLPSCDALGFLIGDVFYWVTDGIEDVLSTLISTDAALTGHRLQDVFYMIFARFGSAETETARRIRNWIPNTAFDTEIAAYLLNPNGGKNDRETLYFSEFHRTGRTTPEESAQTDLFGLIGDDGGPEATSFETEDAEKALSEAEEIEALAAVYGPRLAREGLTRVFTECELPLIEAMATMEAKGFRVDRASLVETGKELSGRISELEEAIYALSGEPFNIASPKQLGTILFEKLMLPAEKKTKTGYSTNADVLEKLRPLHPIIDKILEYRTVAKLKSTYVEGMLPLIHKDGRIHAHFQQTVTSTGRISCTEPNLQNIPVRYEEGRRLRKAFVPNEAGEVLAGADYSQIELRVLAALSGDESLSTAFQNGEDIHRATAANVLGKNVEDVTDAERSAAKAINFGLIYGKTSYGLSRDLNISVKAAEEYIERYFAKYPTVRDYLDGLKKAARETGYATTLLGRKRPIPEITASQFTIRQLGERLAMNSPIQGTAADIIKLAMVRVNRALKKGNYRSRLILQVHDELILSCAKDELEAVETLLIENMENAFVMAVPMRAELETSDNWYNL